jgi:hypothetical protein
LVVQVAVEAAKALLLVLMGLPTKMGCKLI